MSARCSRAIPAAAGKQLSSACVWLSPTILKPFGLNSEACFDSIACSSFRRPCCPHNRNLRMQRSASAGSIALQPVAAPDAIQATVRSSRGDGTRVFVVDAPADGKIADVKQLLCCPPHSVCSHASTLVLLLKGKGAAVACA